MISQTHYGFQSINIIVIIPWAFLALLRFSFLIQTSSWCLIASPEVVKELTKENEVLHYGHEDKCP